MSSERKSLFASQQSEDLQIQSRIFYEVQDKYIEKHGIKYNKSRNYISKEFLQRIVTVMQKINKRNKSNKNVEWLFSKSMDILIRHNITDGLFIQHNDSMKGCFYNNAMYRVFKFGLKSFNPEYSAFVYFTSTIRMAFKEEINSYNQLLLTSNELKKSIGVEGSFTNLDKTIVSDMESDYNVEYNISVKENIPMFIMDVVKQFGKLKPIEIVVNPNDPIFKRKKVQYDFFLPVTVTDEDYKARGKIKSRAVDKGVIIKYIDLYDTNENSGQTATALYNELLIARKNGHQCFYIFSDIYMDESISDEIIFKKLEKIIEYMKSNNQTNTGLDLMFDYIPSSFLDLYEVDTPSWYLLNYKLEKRELPINQNVDFYLEMKNSSEYFTRIFDGGKLNKSKLI